MKVAAILMILSGLAQAQQPQDLPQELPADVLKDFLPFHKYGVPSREAPIYSEFRAFGFVEDTVVLGLSTVNTDPTLKVIEDWVLVHDTFFSDDHWVKLPEGEKIFENRRGKQKFWRYPVGTQVVHRIFLNGTPSKLLEFRTIKKRRDGGWDFGSYIPGADGKLSLRPQLEKAPMETHVTKLDTKDVTIEFRRINNKGCQVCHFVHGEANHQYRNESLAGPCNFVPGNAHLKSWIEAFTKKFGYPPIQQLTSPKSEAKKDLR